MNNLLEVRNLNTEFHTLLDHIADTADDLKVQTAMLIACQRLTADLQQYALIFGLVHN